MKLPKSSRRIIIFIFSVEYSRYFAPFIVTRSVIVSLEGKLIASKLDGESLLRRFATRHARARDSCVTRTNRAYACVRTRYTACIHRAYVDKQRNVPVAINVAVSLGDGSAGTTRRKIERAVSPRSINYVGDIGS